LTARGTDFHSQMELNYRLSEVLTAEDPCERPPELSAMERIIGTRKHAVGTECHDSKACSAHVGQPSYSSQHFNASFSIGENVTANRQCTADDHDVDIIAFVSQLSPANAQPMRLLHGTSLRLPVLVPVLAVMALRLAGALPSTRAQCRLGGLLNNCKKRLRRHREQRYPYSTSE
jgi:hypothetical protein